MSKTIVTNTLGTSLILVALLDGVVALATTEDEKYTYLYKALAFVDEAEEDQVDINGSGYSRVGDDLNDDQVAEWKAKIAVAKHLSEDDEVFNYKVQEHKFYGGLLFVSASGKEFGVGTEEEAQKGAAEYIKDSLWAFKSSFLASFTDLPEEVFTGLQEKCEGANDTFLKLVERADGGLEEFTNQAISTDGRGHFLSGYNGEENEETLEGVTYYIYRIN